MHLFYVKELLPEMKSICLSEDESKHACRVLRLVKGDNVTLLDGVGGVYRAIIVEDKPKECHLTIESYSKEQGQNFEIHIALCPTKNMDRIEWFVEKATELGLTELSFILTSRSERKILKLERIEKIALSAMKQSKRAFLPKINPPISLDDFLICFPKGGIAFCEDEFKNDIKSVSSSVDFPILIGPEGDFTAAEVLKAKSSGYHILTLGKTRLRTETAALYACATLKMLFE